MRSTGDDHAGPRTAGSTTRRWVGRGVAVLGLALGVLNWLKEIDDTLPSPLPHNPFFFVGALLLLAFGLWLMGAFDAKGSG